MNQEKAISLTRDVKEALQVILTVGVLPPEDRTRIEAAIICLSQILKEQTLDNSNAYQFSPERRSHQDFVSNLLEETIPNLFQEDEVIARLPRKVRIRKKKDANGSTSDSELEVIGWEQEPPNPGERYLLLIDDGRRFDAGVVLEYSSGDLRTTDSSYALEILIGS